jgi:Transposase zinc-binding domain
MPRQALEVADIFRDHGPAWRREQAGHLSLGQLKVMSAIERCRTAALGGHVAQCPDCGHRQIAYNSCRNRHCPKCQGAVAKQWLAVLALTFFHRHVLELFRAECARHSRSAHSGEAALADGRA